MRQRRTAQWRQHGDSSAEASAESPALPANALTHVPSNTTNAPTYPSLSLVKEGGTTMLTALSLSAAMAAPMVTSTAVADAPPPPPPMTPPLTTLPTPTAMPKTSFVKLNLI